MKHGEFDAIVIGAGPAGSTAAILLARAGWSVALAEKQRFPRRKVCGECIAASNLALLGDLGLGSALEHLAGSDLARVAWMQGAREVVGELPRAADARHPWGRALGRETLDTLLLDEARQAGVHVLQPWSVQDLAGRAGAWRVQARAIDSGSIAELRARVAIAAHGSWEACPAQRQDGRPQRHAGDLFAFKANFRDAVLPSGTLPVLSLDGGYGGMVRADGGMATIACCVRRDRLEALRRAAPGLRAGDAVEAWLKRECLGVRRALEAATRSQAWLSSGPLDPGIRVRAGEEFFRIGNAAGEAHPIVGEGISMALQSAMLLCGHLLGEVARGRVPDRPLQRAMARHYRQDWRRNFARRVHLAALIAHVAMRPAPAALLMALLRAHPALLTAGARWVGKTRTVRAALPPEVRARMPGGATGRGADLREAGVPVPYDACVADGHAHGHADAHADGHAHGPAAWSRAPGPAAPWRRDPMCAADGREDAG